MCRSERDPDGPRRCPGDARAAYHRTAVAVLDLEHAEAELMQELAAIDTGAGGSSGGVSRPVVSFPDKETRTEDIRREIDTAIDELNTGENWRQWLEFSGKFHKYSLNNQLLIYMQKPDATQVAGFNKWKELGRSVTKGEKAIWIFAPMVRKVRVEDAKGNPVLDAKGKPRYEQKVTGFKTVPVFDVSSTDGEPLPQPPVVEVDRMSGSAPEGMHEDLTAQIEGHGYRVVYEDLGDGPGIPDGRTVPDLKTVTINTHYSHAHQGLVLAHELAHIECGHTEQTDKYHTGAGGERSTMEVEAQSVSYVVGRRWGLTDNASFSYIDGWAHGDKEKIRKTAESVIKATDRIMARSKLLQTT
ncbi:ImmA/IrrE family metallo-endopeptidase [Mycobacterium avium subsp. hominissuis]|nr:ImmA/IrrE family metallo-endopeptidase [Mycobacterium avium subsp. hominissuis]